MTEPRFIDTEVQLVGPRWSPRLHEVKDFLARSRVRFRWFDTEGQAPEREPYGAGDSDEERLPRVVFPDGTILVDPDPRHLAEKLGLDTEPDSPVYDLIVLGGGPAGLTGAIHGGSDGLRVLVVEQGAVGGQAGYSARIENYPGFPDGLSGSDLARRSTLQAERFGVEVLVTRRATALRTSDILRQIVLDDGTELAARAVLLALGVSFRWLEAPGCPALVGAGIYYGAATAEASACRDQEIYILGGGNSAGQAALLLARYARRVSILTDEATVEDTMSRYLVDRIRDTRNIEVRTRHTVVGAEGNAHLEGIAVENLDTGETEIVPASGLFVFIGATPGTDWLGDAIGRDEKGFVLSGHDYLKEGRRPPSWPLERAPHVLETSVPGVFVAGDVRRGSVKRLSAAAGDGAIAAALAYRYLSGDDSSP